MLGIIVPWAALSLFEHFRDVMMLRWITKYSPVHLSCYAFRSPASKRLPTRSQCCSPQSPDLFDAAPEPTHSSYRVDK